MERLFAPALLLSLGIHAQGSWRLSWCTPPRDHHPLGSLSLLQQLQPGRVSSAAGTAVGLGAENPTRTRGKAETGEGKSWRAGERQMDGNGNIR